MALFHLFVLAVVQGITEFLPISSSGHLELAWEAMDSNGVALPADSQRLILFVAVHLGTLFAVMLYTWRDVAALTVGVLKLLVGQWGPGARLALYIIVGTLPLVAAGLFFKDVLLGTFYNAKVIAWANIGFAVLLYLGDRVGMTLRRIEHMTLGSILAIGLAQTFALVPGTSRSGVTMTAARFLGFERTEAARISLLLAIPAILGAATLESLDLYRLGDLQLGLDAAIAAGLAFVSALVSITAMMAWLRRASFTPFVVYRLVLGAVLLWLIYQGRLASLPTL